MSSDDDSPERPGQDSKRRRVQRACDACRRKKIRCDGIQQIPGKPCTNCSDYNLDCTYVENSKKRGPPKSYIEGLEKRVQKLQDLLTRISPEALEILDAAPHVPVASLPLHTSPAAPQWAPHDASPSRFIRNLGSGAPASPHTADDDDAEGFLAHHFEKLNIHNSDRRYFGKSSGVMLIKTALELKRKFMGETEGEELEEPELTQGRGYWIPPTLSLLPQPPRYNFPPPDLTDALIDLYFIHVNTYLPLLHRPTFKRAVSNGLHHTDAAFAPTLLLVCAVASRYSDDPRVMDDPDENTTEPGGAKMNAHSCGWKWFAQVSMVKSSCLSLPSLYELQFYALVGQFVQASSVPQACWTVVGIGIRVAQDVGAHRRRVREVHTVEDELWKRAFWVLVCMDRLFSSSLGRPCSIHDEDFDVDMPIECDDEYWEHPDPELRWRQPTPEKTPSTVVYFNAYIRLNQILAFLLRTVYAINKSRILLGFVGQQWEENIVSELDSALNGWVDKLPDHLRWDPTRTNEVFFNQSASLYSAYYHIQILVHRPFIPSPRKPGAALSFPSLAICTNAARACSHVVDIQRKRFQVAPPPLQTAAFSAGVVLLLSIWGGKRSGLATDFNKEMADVERCMDVLKEAESRWYLSGRLRDILQELATVGDLPIPQKSATSGSTKPLKREREPDVELKKSLAPTPDSLDAQQATSVPSTRHQEPVASSSGSGNRSHGSYHTHEGPVLEPTLQQPYAHPGRFDTTVPPTSHPRRNPYPPVHRTMENTYWQNVAHGHRKASSNDMASTGYTPTYTDPPWDNQSFLPNAQDGYDSSYYAADHRTMSSLVGQNGGGYTYPYREDGSFSTNGGVGHPPSAGRESDTVFNTIGGDGPQTSSGPIANDAYAMWSDAPAGFGLSEWGHYLSNLNEATGQYGHNAPLRGSFSNLEPPVMYTQN